MQYLAMVTTKVKISNAKVEGLFCNAKLGNDNNTNTTSNAKLGNDNN